MKSSVVVKCSRCKHEVPLRSLISEGGHLMSHNCNADDWSIIGEFRTSSTDFHVGQNILGLGMAAAFGVGYRVKPTTRVMEGTIFIKSISRSEIHKFLRRPDELSVFRALEILSRKEMRQHAVEAKLTQDHWVNCYQCHGKFVPRVLLERFNAVEPGQFLHNRLCSEECLKKFETKVEQIHCVGCGRDVELVVTKSKPMWREYGFCSESCYKSQPEKSCVICSKTYFVAPSEVPPLRKFKLAAQQRGLCGLNCYADNLAKIGPLKISKAVSKIKVRQGVKVACSCSHVTQVPVSHKSNYYLCLACGSARKLVLS